MAAPSSASPAVLTTHSSIDEVSEPRRVPHEIFLAILDELIEVSEASMAGALWILTAEFPHFSGWPSGFACQPNFVRQQGHRLACFTRIALISKDAQAIDEFLIHYESFYYIGGRVPWTPDLFCRTSLLPYVETLSIPYISPPDRFARIFSDFSNVRLFLIESQCRDWSKRFNDKHKLCSHGNLLPVDENLLPILQAGSPDRQSIKKALDRGAHVILKCYIDRNDVEVFSTQKGLRVKFSHCEFKCACDATRRDWLEKHRYLSSSERRLTEG
uniref:Uncharacterized protein n=1 Tax=Colletotrichum fructicola (strain Nara gc5) TaxID=1213859 RepID=L2G209_COLFN